MQVLTDLEMQVDAAMQALIDLHVEDNATATIHKYIILQYLGFACQGIQQQGGVGEARVVGKSYYIVKYVAFIAHS
jgi:hypothetical protein